MSSTEEFVRVLLRCGRKARFCKNDWASAYKHMRVKKTEIWMQGFMWLGRVFCELCLVFGGKSSAGLYDQLAKLVLWIAISISQFPEKVCVQLFHQPLLKFLGICYDTEEGVNGTWYLREDKMANIILMLEKAIEGDGTNQRLIKSLCGKLLQLRFLVGNSKYKMG